MTSRSFFTLWSFKLIDLVTNRNHQKHSIIKNDLPHSSINKNPPNLTVVIGNCIIVSLYDTYIVLFILSDHLRILNSWTVDSRAFIQTDHYHEAYQLIVNDQRLELVFILLTLVSYFGRLSLEHLLKGTIAINVGKNMTEHLTKIPPQFRLELEGRVWWQQFLKNFCNLVKSRDL